MDQWEKNVEGGERVELKFYEFKWGTWSTSQWKEKLCGLWNTCQKLHRHIFVDVFERHIENENLVWIDVPGFCCFCFSAFSSWGTFARAHDNATLFFRCYGGSVTTITWLVGFGQWDCSWCLCLVVNRRLRERTLWLTTRIRASSVETRTCRGPGLDVPMEIIAITHGCLRNPREP